MKSDIFSRNADSNGKPDSESKSMNDVAMAIDLVEEIGASRHIGQMLGRAAKELNKRFPHKTEPKKKWTARRLKRWWNNESNTVQFYQMIELISTAEDLRRAREEHAAYKQKTQHIYQMALAAKEAADSRLASR